VNKIYIVLPEKVGYINPNIYGHFTEHIGGVIYDGIWVGENSKIPNIKGFRKDLIELMKKINPPIIRWPGGCFAEAYDWRDGIGPREQRPKAVNWWYKDDGKLESNEVGTHEFIEFCRLTGADPYFAANITSTTPLEIRNWIEYCNFPESSTSLAKLRESNGSLHPFDIKYWGIGNENWGGGGYMTPEDYCCEYRKYAIVAGSVSKIEHNFIACGPNGNDLEWTRRFFEKWNEVYSPSRPNLQGYSAHYYCGTSGDALNFDENQWYELLHKAGYMEDLVVQQRALMDSYDPERKIGLIIDEWGCWHPDGSGPSKGKNLFEQQSTMRDALVAAITLNIFNSHCDKVVMANIAQLVNNLHSLFLAAEDKLITTPNYHVFDMYKGHQGGMALCTLVEAEKLPFKSGTEEKQTERLSCSASLKDKKLTVTLVNTHFTDETELELNLLGLGKAGETRQVTLKATDPHMYNSFEEPDKIKPVTAVGSFSGSRLSLSLPPASVTLLEIDFS
jgi:alpha-N-arabinofuranosidase